MFQNRFKSILCQEDLYLKELVGYIYLNPLWDEIVAERILGDSDFVKEVLAEQKEQFERRYRLKAHGYDIDRVVQKVAEVLKIEQEEIWKPGNQPLRVNARSLVCYWAVRELGMSGTSVGKLLGLDQPAVSHAVLRGEKLTQVLNLKLNIRNQHLIFKRRPGSRAFPEKKI